MDSTRYRHTQTGQVIIGALGGAALLMLALGRAALRAGALGAGLIAAAAVLFSSLTVTVDEQAVDARFGPGGLIGRRILLSEVVSCRQVRNEWWYGWGIRWIGTGWLYNVSGLDAVEVTLRDGERFRIGTDDPDGLSAALQARLAR